MLDQLARMADGTRMPFARARLEAIAADPARHQHTVRAARRLVEKIGE